MKTKHSVWKNKLAKTMFLFTVVLIAALFVGSAASAGYTANETPTQIPKQNPNAEKDHTVNPSSVNEIGFQPQGECESTPQVTGDKAFLMDQGFEDPWVPSSDPDDPIPYDVPTGPFGDWDVDGLCVASQSGYPDLTHYWSQFNYPSYPLPHSGDYCAGLWWSDGSGGDYVQDEWIKTPFLDLSAYPVGLELSCWGVFYWSGGMYGDNLEIVISDDGTNWFVIIDILEQQLGGAGYGGYGWNWNEVPIIVDLSENISIAGLDPSNIQIGWHCYTDYGDTISGIAMLDDVQITVPAASIHVEKQIYVETAGEPEYTICLEDAFGDGWNGGYLDIYVNGVAVYLGLTLADGAGPECYPIPVANGDVIFIDYTYGSWAYENIWYLLDNDGNQVFYEVGSYDDVIHDQTVTVSLGGGTGDYTIGLEDTFGDGWNGGYLDIYVNGVAVYMGLTLDYVPGPECYPITVADGDTIFVDYTYGSWAYENIWYLIDTLGNEVFREYGSYDNNIHDQTVTASVPLPPPGVWVDADTPEEALDLQICTIQMFKITVTNDGDYPLYSIYVYDWWDESLEFIEADPMPMYWEPYFAAWWDPAVPFELMPGESFEILVWFHIVGPHCHIDYNLGAADAYSDYEPYYVYDEDYAYVHCVDEFHIDIEKYVHERTGTAEWTITLEDAYGDGWNGGYLDIYVNGVAIYEGLTIASGPGPESHPLTVTDGDEIFVDYTYGSWAYENIWYLEDEFGNLIFYQEGDYDNDACDHTVIAQVGAWLDSEQYAQGDIAKFLIKVTNDGMTPLTDIDVYDLMSDSLQFVDADPYPDEVPMTLKANTPQYDETPSGDVVPEPETSTSGTEGHQAPATLGEVVLWDNNMVWGYGLGACQLEPTYGELGSDADDFEFTVDTDVNRVNWIGGFWNGDMAPFDWNLTFYVDDGTGAHPGALFAGPYIFSDSECNPEVLLEGSTDYLSYSVDLPTPLTFSGGVQYWLAVQGQGVFPPQSGIAIHNDTEGGVIGHEMLFRSAYFGYYDWNDSHLVWGDYNDFAFQLSFYTPDPYDLHWYFPGPLNVSETIEIIVWAEVVGDVGDIDENHVWVTTDEGVGDADSAFVEITDLTPPVTTHAFAGTMGEDDWYVSDVTITLSATDDYSGVDYTMIDVDGGGFEEYTGAIVVSDAGDHDIRYYSVDTAGNVEATKGPFEFKIDQTAPVSTHTLAGTMGEDDWYISDVTITLSATDETSGVGEIFYKIDSGAWAVYTDPVVVSADGNHQLYYNASDAAGNMEATNGPFAFKIDQTAPEWINYSFEPLNAMKTQWLCHAEVEDATSGVVLVEFYVDDALVGSATDEPYEFEFDGKPTTSSQAIAYDAAGNSAMSPIADEYTYEYNPQSSQPVLRSLN